MIVGAQRIVIAATLRNGNMGKEPLAETRSETIYTDVGNADIAGANICHPWGSHPHPCR